MECVHGDGHRKEYNDERFQTSASASHGSVRTSFSGTLRERRHVLSLIMVSARMSTPSSSAPFHDPDSPRCQLLAEVTCGVHHAIDVPYVFGSPDDQSNASLAVSATLGAVDHLCEDGSPAGRNNTADQLRRRRRGLHSQAREAKQRSSCTSRRKAHFKLLMHRSGTRSATFGTLCRPTLFDRTCPSA